MQDRHGYWKDIEPKNKRCMILHMEAGNYVRPSGSSRKDLGADNIKSPSLKVRGAEYFPVIPDPVSC
ncbi:MAG: hypothetical protein IJQ24_07865 [Synergistaceae bacterium]|nr:hypothetical protein [Synergistaceae bacterium]